MWLAICRGHVIDKSRDHDITIAFFFRHTLYWACSYLLKRNFEWKSGRKFLNQWDRLKRKTRWPIKTSYPHREANESQKDHVIGEKPSNPMMGD